MQPWFTIIPDHTILNQSKNVPYQQEAQYKCNLFHTHTFKKLK